MAAEIKRETELEIAHVLFLDIVGYSKLSVNEQHSRIEELNEAVRLSDQFQKAEAANRILKIPTGDGMALVFYKSPEEPAQCAFEISRALKDNPRLQMRMGIHSGPVSGVVDVNQRTNVAGAGINMAQRVMDCGDAGHILLSKHVAEDLENYERWGPFLHDVGTLEVKHGVRVNVTNLYSNEVGNPQLPSKLQAVNKHRTHVRWTELAIGVLVLFAIVGGAFFFLRRPTGSASAMVEKSIAVLPFENLSSDKENAFFTDGVQDEILTDLAKIADLKVISRTSVMQYKSGVARNLRKIGEELGAAHVVEGSVQRAANKIRVNAQLIDARNDAHLWAQTYDRGLADVFAIQSEIAKAIADQLQARLSPSEKNAIERPPTNDITAFDLYARAKNLLLALSGTTERTDLLQAADLLNQAVARDPSFLEAYCQLANAHDLLYFFGYDHTPARLTLAEAAVQAASRLRPDAGETHLAHAQNLYQGYLDYDGAFAELEVARQTLPNNPRVLELMAFIQRRQGRWQDSTQNLERAVDLDPRNVFTLNQITITYDRLRWHDKAKSMLDRIVAIEPDNLNAKLASAGMDLEKGDSRPFCQMIDSVRAINPAAIPTIANSWLTCALVERDAASANDALIAMGDNPISLGNDNVNFSRPFVEGVIARMANDDEKARAAFTAARAEQEKIVHSQSNYAPPLAVLGLIDAGLGHKQEALREGRRAVELLPVQKDALDGTGMITYLAMIAAWVGDKDLACEQLDSVIRRPSDLSYGGLKLMPLWDPLRGDPRFEQLVEKAKQPVALQ